MLETALKTSIVLALALACLAPAAAAAVHPEETLQDAEDQASGVHPWVGWALDKLPGDEGQSGDGSDGGSSGSSSGSSDGGEGSPGPSASTLLAPAKPVVIYLRHTAEGAVDGLPKDPIGSALGELKPVQDTAEGVRTLILPPSEGQADGMAPATATVEPVVSSEDIPLLAAGVTVAAAAAVAVLWLAGSSGSLGAGAGAAGTGGKLAGADLRRLLPFASPLFTRFEKDTVLGHPKREALYALILQDPGVSLQSLCDSTGLSRTAVTHHLRLMELQHLIVSKRMGRSRHYYENGGRFGRDQKDAYAVLQNDRSKEVADFVKKNPGAIQKAICAAVGVQASVAHWHLKRLQEAQLVEAVRNGRTVAYFPGAGLRCISDAPAPAVPVEAPVAALPALPMPASPSTLSV